MTMPSHREGPRRFRHLDAGLGPAIPIDAQHAARLVELAVATVIGEQRQRRTASSLTQEGPLERRLASAPAQAHAHALDVGDQPLRIRRFTTGRWLVVGALVVTTSAAATTVALKHFVRSTSKGSISPAAAPSLHLPKAGERRQRGPEAASAVGAPASAIAATVGAPANASGELPRATAMAPSSVTLLPFTSPSASQRANAALRDRLAQANVLRQSGHWREAEAAYLEIARQYSAAPEFEVASLAAAALRLEHLNDPQGALHLYESLAPEAALSPEARYGVARCHRALGDVVAEDAALSALIDHAPNSIQAERARQRLTQLQSKKGTGRISDGANPN